MTPEQWEAERRRLQGAITRAKKKVQSVELLADKIEAKRVVKQAEEDLRQHKLNYYELVTDRIFPELEVVVVPKKDATEGSPEDPWPDSTFEFRM